MSLFDSARPTSPDSPQAHRRVGRRAVSLLGKAVAAVLVVVPTVFVVGAFVPDVPILGIATAIVGLVPVWFAVAPALGAGLAGLAWRGRRTRVGTALLLAGVLGALGGGVITTRMVTAADRAGAEVSVLDAFTLEYPWSADPDDEPTYLVDQGEDLKMSVYRPGGDRADGSSAPVLMYIHGGGWSQGSRDNFSARMRWFVDRGYLVLSVDYSLSGPHRHLWDVVPDQIGCALSWVTDNADTYGGDANRVSLSGDSAGGNLAINAAYLQAAGRVASTCDGTPARVGAVSVTYPGVDLRKIHHLTSDGAAFTVDYTGGTPDEVPDRYDAVDSSTHIAPSAPPTLIVTGAADHLVPPDSVSAFADRVAAAGVDTHLVRVPHADHVFDSIPGSVGDQAYRQLTMQWLDEHGQAP